MEPSAAVPTVSAPWTGLSISQQTSVKPMSSINLFYPMYVVPMKTVLGMECMEHHELLLRDGKVLLKSQEVNVLFVSQTWLSFKSPDRGNVKWDLLKIVLQDMLAGTFVVHASWVYQFIYGKLTVTGEQCQALTKNGSVWFDFCSIPQEDAQQMALAVQSIPAYISSSDMFMVLAPTAVHENGMDVDVRTWASRGWCRAERVINVLSPTHKPEILVESSTARSIVATKDWHLNPVGKGLFAVEADRASLGRVLDDVISAGEIHALARDDLTCFRLLAAMRFTILEGTGFEVNSALSYDAWMKKFRFQSAHDGRESGWTPLRFAMCEGRLDIAQRLIDASADLNAPLAADYPFYFAQKGMTILHFTMLSQDAPEYIEFLLDRKADPELRDSKHNSILSTAVAASRIRNFDFVASRLPDLYGNSRLFDCFMYAVMWGRCDMVEHMHRNWQSLMRSHLDKRGHPGTHPNYRNAFDSSVVRAAVTDVADLSMLEMVLDMGYDVDAQNDSSYQAWRPWMLCRIAEAAYAVKGDQAGNFIEYFANMKGGNALILASSYGNAIAVKKLLSVRADASKANHYGRSALHCAAGKGHLAIVKLLLAAGAPVGEPDSKGLTASALARRGGHIKTEHVLLNAGDVPRISGRANLLCCTRRHKKLSVTAADVVFQLPSVTHV